MRACFAAVLALAVGRALADGDYTFTLIADSQDAALTGFGPYSSINSAGQVAFMAFLSNGERAVYWGDGGPLHLVADHSGPLGIITDHQIISIGDTGQVAFRAILDAGPFAVVRTDGGPMTTIAQSGGQFAAVNTPTINAHDKVAFSATLQNGDQNVYVGDGGTPTLILDGAGPYQPYGSVYYPDLNDANKIAVVAEKDPGNLEFDILRGDQGGMPVLYSSPTVDFTWFQDFSLAMNNLGVVQFLWFKTNAGNGISTGTGGAPTTIVAPNGPVGVTYDHTAISGVGRTVFNGAANGDSGVFTGPQVTDCVLAAGDVIFGRVVDSFGTVVSQDGVNDAGQIAIRVLFTDGTSAIVRANPKPACAPLPPNAVLWTKFDEPIGPNAKNSIGGNDGTHVGPVFVENNGKVERALELFGNGGYVNVPSYPAIEIGDGDFTIDAWVRVTDLIKDDRRIVDKRALNDALNEVGYTFFTRNGELACRIANGGGGGGYTDYLSGVFLPPDDAWHLVAVTVDRDQPNGLVFYLDGVPVGLPMNPTDRQGSLANSMPLRVGGYTLGPGLTWHGLIDEVEVFTRALDASEILSIYEAGSAGKCTSYCTLPWDVPFCKNQNAVSVTGYICNMGTTPETYHYSFSGLPEPLCGAIDGPATFTPFGGTVTVGPGVCEPITFTVTRPAQMTSAFLVACYEMAVLKESTGEIATCRGSVQDRRDLCTVIPNLITTSVGQIADVAVGVTNTSDTAVQLEYEFAVYDDQMLPDDDMVSLGGLPPGSRLPGSVFLQPNEEAELAVGLQFLGYDPARFYSLVMQVPDGQVGAGALASSLLMNVIEPTCPADCNDDGSLDILDFVCFQNQFTAGDPAADCDGSGALNILDFVCYQNLFTSGCP